MSAGPDLATSTQLTSSKQNLGALWILLFLLASVQKNKNLTTMSINLKTSLEDVTFACINCNSLNMSKLGTEKQKVKIYGICSLRAHVIFLSDIRLSNSHGVSFAHDLEKLFAVTPYGNYKFLHNSKSNKRGVGILINYRLNFSVLDVKADEVGNILVASVCLNGTNVNIGAIYGPVPVKYFSL